MRPVPAAVRTAAALVLLSLVTAGCSGSTDSVQAKSSPKSTQGADEIAYYRCLADRGIPLDTTDDGVLRVKKGKDNNAAILAAEKKCAGLRPAPTTVLATEEDMARARKLSACLREHGVKGYPDPGPDGDAPLSNEMAYAMKTNPDYREANRVCDPRPEDDSVVGG
ncbi:hypothetical protein [Streptomyces brevispora]|uniref:Subtilisin inhibitor-like n=1 Tax=Streptomyces brevispora TaxID=887462 RepID=A0ABZ1G271_9ACTN|nr:hypothetical protein [Streptomyces brevispora]WSC13973.1 hypothetical protein OIE64_14705 [Streptomyces brevispora]